MKRVWETGELVEHWTFEDNNAGRFRSPRFGSVLSH
jgi:hypothetical protein